ncbi:MAG: hypothetical protein A2234_02455 [Elusimicrobia bacterium RIFOXYA2_FULL_58_8]|nr:MAG: hypothetical protein A2285_09245 [Elusimicrobia bacterium RIFOXYA12_FULL_57_11]OGS13171.1 MAG: hypothetical protein A2234_02455 [Elusimicrobia bacterium RIFOXYA2_FULL_58_8]
MRPLVSVCIPVYNGARFIGRALDSALAQTYAPLELVVLDNASTDNTVEIVSRYLGDPRVRLVRNLANIGAISNFNKAVSEARGEFIKILCADDYLRRDCLEKQAAPFLGGDSARIVMTCSPRSVVGEDEAVWLRRGFAGREGVVDGREAVRLSVRAATNLPGESSCVLLRASALKAAGGFRDKFSLCMDIDCWSRMLVSGDLYVTAGTLCYYRISPRSWSISIARLQSSDYLAFIDEVARDGRFGLTGYDLGLGRLRARLNGGLRSFFSRVVFLLTAVNRRCYGERNGGR